MRRHTTSTSHVMDSGRSLSLPRSLRPIRQDALTRRFGDEGVGRLRMEASTRFGLPSDVRHPPFLERSGGEEMRGISRTSVVRRRVHVFCSRFGKGDKMRYPMWHVRFVTARNLLSQSCCEMEQATSLEISRFSPILSQMRELLKLADKQLELNFEIGKKEGWLR